MFEPRRNVEMFSWCVYAMMDDSSMGINWLAAMKRTERFFEEQYAASARYMSPLRLWCPLSMLVMKTKSKAVDMMTELNCTNKPVLGQFSIKIRKYLNPKTKLRIFPVRGGGSGGADYLKLRTMVRFLCVATKLSSFCSQLENIRKKTLRNYRLRPITEKKTFRMLRKQNRFFYCVGTKTIVFQTRPSERMTYGKYGMLCPIVPE